MNVIKIDMDKIKKAIDEYVYQNTDLMFQINTIINYEYPIILMNEDTFLQIEKESSFLLKGNLKHSPRKIFGCHIAIADWLPFGEVKLK